MDTKNLSKLDEFYSDIIITAVEGGIGYWSHCRNYYHGYSSPRTAAYVTVYATSDEYDGYAVGLPLTTKEIAKAMRRIADLKQPLSYAGDEWRGRMAKALRKKDAYDIDAADADGIVQIALFGEITYG